ncbi:hypothetical protein PAAG_11113 [Paracoccidioides lutzii Pb01]|uniref:Uncharacterized protein n=1 Tax=Paracoccidioides lutzii (strain ATCC MYA-826 / Pb01) TaxID=502779 RepID=A0A0A2V3Y7_PARBA|nr:hypothetical protein PAAG_11113 [Paracoccidioides lutzii Pb01]KGQ02158.1 hypothetical protein PAAG_11113 [Paracoccidioides lutzii Pb01]
MESACTAPGNYRLGYVSVDGTDSARDGDGGGPSSTPDSLSGKRDFEKQAHQMINRFLVLR